MAKTRKFEKQKGRKTVRGHRSSTAGILPLLDVRSNGHLKELEKRIRKGPLTIVMIYADWCGHCHTMMPHFDAASKSPSRSIQSVKLNEQMLDSANSYLNKNVNKNAKPISVEGYPSIILVDNKGNKVTDIESVRDTNTMTKVMNESASLASQAGISSTPSSMNSVKSMNSVNSLNRNKEPVGSIKIPKSMEEEAEAVTSLTAPVTNSLGYESEVEPEEIMPPTSEESQNTIVGGSRGKGGSLMGVISKTAYTLAPTAALLATASYVMKGNKGTKKRSIHKTKRKMTKKMRKYRK